MVAKPKRGEVVGLDNDVHWHEQKLLGAEGKEFWVQARVKAWVLFFAMAIAYFAIRRLWTRSFDVDVFGVPVLAAYLLMKIVTPQVPIEAHAMAVYYEVRRIIYGWLHRRRTGGRRIGPYSLLSRAATSRRSWPGSGLLARAANLRRNRTDG
jgi:hypothetical protein